MDLLTTIQSEPLYKIQKIVLEKGLPIDSTWLDYDALNRALACKRNDVAKWLLEHSCRVNKFSDSNQSMLDSSPLHNGVKLGNMEIVEMLLKNEASVVAVDSDDNTALHISFLYRYDKVTDLLLDHIVKNSNYNNKKNNQGLSHLHIACSRNNVKVLEGFLKAEADIGDIVKVDSPFSWAGYTALHFAIEFKSLEAAKVLLAAGCKMEDDDSSNTGQSPLQLLHHHRDKYLIMSDHLDKNKFSNLHTACLRESANVVKKFIDAGADINEAIEWDGSLCNYYSPLHFAIKSPYDRKEKVELLLTHGATVEGRYLLKQNHMTALHSAFYEESLMDNLDSTIVDCLYKAVRNRKENFVDENELSYFHISVTRNDFVAVKTYLDNRANVNQAVLQNDHGFSGYTALLFAVEYRQKDMAKYLIERGANVNARASKNHQTPLFKAFQMGDIDLIKLLLKSGALLTKTTDPLGNTLLQYAAELGSDEIVKYLIDSGAYDVNCRNNLGKNPVLMSIEVDTPCYEVVEILLNNGADIFMEDCNDEYAMATANSRKWLIPDMERLRIFTRFLKEETDLMHFDILEEVNANVIEVFLQTGVDLFSSYNNGERIIHLLAQNSNPGVIEHLRGHDFDVDARDNQGYTPLLYAAVNGIANAVEFFLDQGADIEAMDHIRHETALYIAMESSPDMIKQYRGCVQILLERGANAQVETDGNANPTILDAALSMKNYQLIELALAHLAFQEANGTAITELIRHKITSRERFKRYYEFCQQQLSDVISNSVTLFDVLAASERKLESYLRKKMVASKLKTYETIDYFKTILSKRLPGPSAMVELRKATRPVVCELMMIDYDSYPGIAEEIVDYLEKQDLENLISMCNRLIYN